MPSAEDRARAAMQKQTQGMAPGAVAGGPKDQVIIRIPETAAPEAAGARPVAVIPALSPERRSAPARRRGVMEKALAAAAELGRQIAQDEAFQRLRAAETPSRATPPRRKSSKSSSASAGRSKTLEGDRKPVEPEDKHEMIRLSDAVHSAPKLQELVRAQADYMELMNRVNKAIQQALASGQNGCGFGRAGLDLPEHECPDHAELRTFNVER